MKTASKLNN